jgi:aldose 1-epimerase
MQELIFGGEQLEAVVLPEAGGRLHRLRAFGRDLLRTPADITLHLADPFFWGAYVMAPWCNRLEAGPMRIGSRRLDLEPNFPDGTAIHGQVYARPWDVQPDRSLSVRAGGGGWPWRYEVTERIEVSGASLRLELVLTNLDDEPMPSGLGVHPWFLRPEQVAIHAAMVFPDNRRGDAAPEPVSGSLDLRILGPIPADVDATWSDLADPAAELQWTGVRGTIEIEPQAAYVLAATPSTLDATALEAQTHAPHGLRRLLQGEPGAMTLMAPGETLRIAVTLSFSDGG